MNDHAKSNKLGFKTWTSVEMSSLIYSTSNNTNMPFNVKIFQHTTCIYRSYLSEAAKSNDVDMVKMQQLAEIFFPVSCCAFSEMVAFWIRCCLIDQN